MKDLEITARQIAERELATTAKLEPAWWKLAWHVFDANDKWIGNVEFDSEAGRWYSTTVLYDDDGSYDTIFREVFVVVWN